MNVEYNGHTYRIEIHGKASAAKGYRIEYILLWVDEKQIKAAPGTYFEPLSTGGNRATSRIEASGYAENAAKRIIDHLVDTGKTIHEL
jgi:hypothetical protein